LDAMAAIANSRSVTFRSFKVPFGYSRFCILCFKLLYALWTVLWICRPNLPNNPARAMTTSAIPPVILPAVDVTQSHACRATFLVAVTAESHAFLTPLLNWLKKPAIPSAARPEKPFVSPASAIGAPLAGAGPSLISRKSSLISGTSNPPPTAWAETGKITMEAKRNKNKRLPSRNLFILATFHLFTCESVSLKTLKSMDFLPFSFANINNYNKKFHI
jgi:hypothetical protein